LSTATTIARVLNVAKWFCGAPPSGAVPSCETRVVDVAVLRTGHPASVSVKLTAAVSTVVTVC
jgi:hypothetical protein